MHEFGEKATLGATRGELFATSVFDYDRMVRFLGWGFIMAPVQLEWFAYLGQVFPITENNQTAMSICRMLCDQILWSPISLALFFIFLTVAEGGGKRAISRKFGVAFIPSLYGISSYPSECYILTNIYRKANFVVWPLVQIINFRWIPLQAQLPFASTVGVFWTTYLSLKNDAADAALLAAASV